MNNLPLEWRISQTSEGEMEKTANRKFTTGLVAYYAAVLLIVGLMIGYMALLAGNPEKNMSSFMMMMMVPLGLFNLFFLISSAVSSTTKYKWTWALLGLPVQLFTLGLLVWFMMGYYG